MQRRRDTATNTHFEGDSTRIGHRRLERRTSSARERERKRERVAALKLPFALCWAKMYLCFVLKRSECVIRKAAPLHHGAWSERNKCVFGERQHFVHNRKSVSQYNNRSVTAHRNWILRATFHVNANDCCSLSRRTPIHLGNEII